MGNSKSKLAEIRITEGWSLNELAGAARISAVTLKRAENDKVVREYIWGKIFQGVNSLKPKKAYEISDIRP